MNKFIWFNYILMLKLDTMKDLVSTKPIFANTQGI